MEPNSGNSNDMAPFPHCDSNILHGKKECQYCDQYPDWQDKREADGINFTGHKDPNKKPCPSEQLRPVERAYRWPGNRPTEIPFEIEEMDDS